MTTKSRSCYLIGLILQIRLPAAHTDCGRLENEGHRRRRSVCSPMNKTTAVVVGTVSL